MLKPNYVEGARKRRETNARVVAIVDDFFKEKEEKREAFVPKALLWKKLGIGLYKLYLEDGGVMPAKYDGLYTSLREVERVIAQYAKSCLDKQH